MLYGDITSQLQYLVKTVQPPLVKVDNQLANAAHFEIGQQLPATVLATLPNGKFHVSIADYGTLEMGLPPNTKNGDNVELIVYQNSPKLTFILKEQNGKTNVPAEVERQLNQNSATLANSKASLSSAASTISQLVARQTQVFQNQQFVQNATNRQLMSEIKDGASGGNLKTSENLTESKGSATSKGGVGGASGNGMPAGKIQEQSNGYAQGEQDSGEPSGKQQNSAGNQAQKVKTLGLQISPEKQAEFSKSANALDQLHQADKTQNANATQKANFVNSTQNLQQVSNPFITGMTRLESFNQMMSNNPLYKVANVFQKSPVLNEIPSSENTEKVAQQMKSVIERSGLFYESHLVDWLNDRRSFGEILHEPQAKLDPETLNPEKPQTVVSSQTANKPSMLETAFMSIEEQYEAKMLENQQNMEVPPKIMHDETTNLVQQQLTLIDNPNQLHWQGQIWQGQQMDWQIQRDLPEGENDNSQEEGQNRQWRSELRLDMGNLGYVLGKISYQGGRTKIELHAQNEDSYTLMKENLSVLQDRLAIADINVLDINIMLNNKNY